MLIRSIISICSRLVTVINFRLAFVIERLTEGTYIAGAVYGIIVATAMISLIEDFHNTKAWDVVIQVLLAVLAFSLAEAYAEIIREHFRHKQGLRLYNLRQLYTNTVPALAGASVVLAPFAYYAIVGMPLELTDDLWGPYGMTDVGVPTLMFVLGLAIGRNVGDSPGRCLLTGFGNMVIAGIVIAFKMGFH